MPTFRIVPAFAVGVAAFLLADVASAADQTLITEKEAKLPAAASVELTRSQRAITRGPKVLLVSPEAPGANPVKSPVKLKLRFNSFGGAKIDTNSIKIVYLKSPEVDLTKRVKPFIAEDGKTLEMEAARVPPGDHIIKVDLKDSDGRPATLSFMLKVAK